MKAQTVKKPRKKYTYAVQDPQQIKFLALYNDPQSPSFGNALQSALKAGYKQEYAENITHLAPRWLQESTIDRVKLLADAERNLSRFATMDTQGDVQRDKLQLDASKFISERIGKQYYSTRSESVNVHVHAVSEETRKQIDTALDDII